MTQEIRDYIRRHGRTAARKQFGDVIDNIDIKFDGRTVGVVKRYWHPQFTCYVWEAVLTHEGQTYSHLDFTSSQGCVDWAEQKILALQKPQFKLMLKMAIQSSCTNIQSLAHSIGCSRYTVHKWIRGESYPEVHLLKRICTTLDPVNGETLFQQWSDQIELER